MKNIIYKALRITLEMLFPSLKRDRLLAEQEYQERIAYYSREIEKNLRFSVERDPRQWSLNPQEMNMLNEMIDNMSDENFVHYRFPVPIQTTHNARLCDLLKSLKEHYHEIDRYRQQDAYEWLMHNVPAFQERSDRLCDDEMI